MTAFDGAAHGPGALQDCHTLDGLFSWRAAQSPDAPAYLAYDPASASWNSFSWQDMAQRVTRVAAALASLDLPRGARVAILLPNGIEAVSVDQAALALGCVPVPMHALDNPASIAYILADSDAAVLVTQNAAQWEAIASLGTSFPGLRKVLVVEAVAADGPGLGPCGFAGWIAAAAPRAPGAVHGADDLAALVYTSGTTGRPKGVMLTHRNVLENVKAVLRRVAPEPGELFLSFLPLSHTFERTAGYYLPIAAGCMVAFARSPALLAEDMARLRPTILVSVPRIYERAHLAIANQLAGQPLKRRLFALAQATGWRRFCRRQGLPVPPGAPAWLDTLSWPLLERLVAGPVRQRFGGRLRVAVSGGAALPASVAQSFIGLGLPILQGYGMTETSPVVAVNALDDNDPATIGRVLDGVEVRIGESRELQVRGPNVMRGYWKRDADTAAAFVDGWLRTGDQAEIVGGRVRILGRIKEIIVTSTGEKIAPADLEQAIAADSLFEQVWVFGESRPYLGCVVVLNAQRRAALARARGLDPDREADAASPALVEALLARIAELVTSFPYYARPRALIVSPAPWTPENTLLTPTLKLKRHNLAHRFEAEIAALYAR
ncbi:long-chain fatty acid--CoA ligase [Massilia sp. X63]|uniref:AMP-dependent synthetase/ligase n=1 Tax=Massilia sp. X63 TaxID=3237285 RepID=UPI0034DCF530